MCRKMKRKIEQIKKKKYVYISVKEKKGPGFLLVFYLRDSIHLLFSKSRYFNRSKIAFPCKGLFPRSFVLKGKSIMLVSSF